AADAAFGSVVAPQELQAGPGSAAFGRMDLLTVVEHELGHVLGLDDLDPQAVPHDLLTTPLAPGVPRLPPPRGEVVAPARAPPGASPAPSALQTPAAPLVVTPVAAVEAAADPLVLTLAAAAEAPAGSLVVTAAAAVAAPALDGSLPTGGVAQRSPGPAV